MINRRIRQNGGILAVAAGILCLVLAGQALGGTGRVTGHRFYVATDGNDAWSGQLPAPNADKTDGPFATLVRSRDAIRQLKATGRLNKPVTVMVRGGTYYLPEPFTLTPQNSGTKENSITYAAYSGEEPILSGG